MVKTNKQHSWSSPGHETQQIELLLSSDSYASVLQKKEAIFYVILTFMD